MVIRPVCIRLLAVILITLKILTLRPTASFAVTSLLTDDESETHFGARLILDYRF